jgi:hypothetical protein
LGVIVAERSLRPHWITLAFGVSLAACTDEVPLGSWHLGSSAGVPSTGGQSGSGGTGGTGGTGELGGSGGMSTGEGGAPEQGCAIPGSPGPRNLPGALAGTTTTNTDWIWPAPSDSLEWEMVIEKENVQDGYFFAQQFGFTAAVGGFFGVQVNGGYRALPPDGPVETTDMLLFWIGGPPERAELGDIPAPDSRSTIETSRGLLWLNIHAKYDLRTCVSYRLRVGRESIDQITRDVWYGAWILDMETDIETFVGRILVPVEWGRLNILTTQWTSGIDYPRGAVPCDQAEPASVFFRTPTANGGMVRPTSHTNRWDDPARCATSRFTELPGGIRHELGI